MRFNHGLCKRIKHRYHAAYRSFWEDDFKCGIDLTNEAFYDKLTNDSNNPSTAAVNPFEFEEIFKNTSMPAMKSWQSSFPNT